MHLPPIQFDCPIALFPLPNCVLFPGAVQPLHIFEPRYRDMLRDTLADDSALAMALLKTGWEKNYHGSPAIHKIVCVGRVIAHEQTNDGKYNLLLQGITRARIVSEQRRDGGQGVYRVAMLQPVVDGPPLGSSQEKSQRRLLKDIFEKTALKELTVAPALTALFEESVPLTRLIDALAFNLVQEVTAKQLLLEEANPAKRGELLLRELMALATRLGEKTGTVRGSTTWPPPLGVN